MFANFFSSEGKISAVSMSRRGNKHPLDADKIKRFRLLNTLLLCKKLQRSALSTRNEINKSICMHRMSLIRTANSYLILIIIYRYLIRLLRILITHTHWAAQSNTH